MLNPHPGGPVYPSWSRISLKSCSALVVLPLARLPMVQLSSILVNTSSLTWLGMPLLTWNTNKSYNIHISNISTRIMVSLRVNT